MTSIGTSRPSAARRPRGCTGRRRPRRRRARPLRRGRCRRAAGGGARDGRRRRRRCVHRRRLYPVSGPVERIHLRLPSLHGNHVVEDGVPQGVRVAIRGERACVFPMLAASLALATSTGRCREFRATRRGCQASKTPALAKPSPARPGDSGGRSGAPAVIKAAADVPTTCASVSRSRPARQRLRVPVGHGDDRALVLHRHATRRRSSR